jgi:hypothetical protein
MFEREYLENGMCNRAQILCAEVGSCVLFYFIPLGV